jgi:dihydrofolate reductase
VSGIRLSIVAAVAENGVIGSGNALPWKLSSDMKRFKALTMGKPVIMGRKTFEAIGKPLAGRVNIVVSGQRGYAPDGVTVAPSLDAALVKAEEGARATGDEEIVVIGGGEIYQAAIGLADRLYITHVEAAPEGDARFPPIDPAHWRATTAERLPAGPRDSAATTFVVYERIGAAVSG